MKQWKHQDWFDENNEEVLVLLMKKQQLQKAYQNDQSLQSKSDAYRAIRQTVQAKLLNMKETWYSEKADEIQAYTDCNNSKCFYDALKSIYGPLACGLSPVLSADGETLITDKEKIFASWAEHFDGFLNRPLSISEAAIARLPQTDINISLASKISVDEVKKATKKPLNGKAPGPDAIPAEIFKNGGLELIMTLTELFNIMLQQERIPQDFKDASLIHIYKRKGNRRCCDNHRGISLLLIDGKILARVILNRLLENLKSRQ